MWCKFCRHLGQPSLRTTALFGANFASLRYHETMEKYSISRNSYPPKSLLFRICAVKHLGYPSSMLLDSSDQFQFNRKLDFKISFDNNNKIKKYKIIPKKYIQYNQIFNFIFSNLYKNIFINIKINYFTSSDPHRNIILIHICHKS